MPTNSSKDQNFLQFLREQMQIQQVLLKNAKILSNNRLSSFLLLLLIADLFLSIEIKQRQ